MQLTCSFEVIAACCVFKIVKIITEDKKKSEDNYRNEFKVEGLVFYYVPAMIFAEAVI